MRGKTQAGRWVEACDLKLGDYTLFRSGEVVLIEAITVAYAHTKVYNFEVEDFHTYAVGEGGALVHNKAQRNTKKGGGKNAQHGREPTPAKQQQLKDLEDKLNKGGLSRKEKAKITNKIKNIKKDIDKTRKGENHSRNSKS